MKIRVLHCISDSNIGGAGRLLLHLLRHFDKDVFDVTAVVPKGSALVPRIEECGIPVIETEHGRDASHDRGGITELCGIMRRVKPHIVHTHSSLDAASIPATASLIRRSGSPPFPASRSPVR